MFSEYRIHPALLHLLYCLLCSAGEEVVRLQELEGNTVTIHTGLTGVQSDAHILWFYRSENLDTKIVISLVFKGETNTEYPSERFRDRLQLNRTSGSLTITNISREDSGVYKLHIITGMSSVWSFSVDVYAPVSKPIIGNQSEKRSVSLRESCSPLCSVENGKDVSLSWYEEKERISSISSSDSSERLYLPLNITNPNCSTYTCVADNPVSSQTTQLDITNICYKSGTKVPRDLSKSLAAVLTSVGLIVALLILFVWIWKKKTNQQGKKYISICFISCLSLLVLKTASEWQKTSARWWCTQLKGCLLCSAGEEVVRLQELEGNTVTIHTGLTGVQSDAHILWFYRSESIEIRIVNSQIIRGEIITDYYSERFRDRLQLNRNSGSLTITNISRDDSGVYKLNIITGISSVWSFSVNVYAPVSKPIIRDDSEKRSVSLRESCSPLCSVENGKDVNLSWYEEKERISSISSSDSSERLYLPLNITSPDYSTYTCVAANPVSNWTTQMNITNICIKAGK
ncbi:uncharacterized protein LOC118803752 [Colossoma macropomum]|uniref:uncharacterized protein LOC118803752 n=1 Tax=Colossoma macropomum TaxID=42526 RepID=UPI00186441E7|nr:uncharacterized protein LOC118803752 [Colossoma macropomum]